MRKFIGVLLLCVILTSCAGGAVTDSERINNNSANGARMAGGIYPSGSSVYFSNIETGGGTNVYNLTTKTTVRISAYYWSNMFVHNGRLYGEVAEYYHKTYWASTDLQGKKVTTETEAAMNTAAQNAGENAVPVIYTKGAAALGGTPIWKDDDDDTFYINQYENTPGIFKITGGKAECLYDEPVSLCIVRGEYLFFIPDDEDGIFRMEKDGSELKRIFTRECGFINVYGDRLYVQVLGDYETGFIAMDLDGKNPELIKKGGGLAMAVWDGYVYYIKELTGSAQLCRRALDDIQTEEPLTTILQ